MARRTTEFKRLSRRCSSLLKGTEGLGVEFKSTVKSVDSSDLVAFSNSASGGAILIGIEESRDANGRQTAKIIGCQVSDEAKLRITSKAMTCQPPIQVEIFTENTAELPFLRVEIPSGELKPYCTGGGTYKLRRDGRVHALHPTELLELYLAKEASQFRHRFQEATEGVLGNLKEIADAVEYLGVSTTNELSELASKLGWVELSADNAESTISSVEDLARDIDVEVDRLSARISAVLHHHGIADPFRIRLLGELKDVLRRRFKGEPDLFSASSYSVPARFARHLPEADLKSAWNEVRAELEDGSPGDD